MSSSWKPVLGKSLLAGLVALGLTLVGCNPSYPSPVNVMAVDLLPNGLYGQNEVQLDVQDISALKGPAGVFAGGQWIIVDFSDTLLQGVSGLTDDQLANVFLKRKGADVRVNYINHTGVLWPVDFQSWDMVTGYFNLQRAYNYFNALGVVTSDQIASTPVYYQPDFSVGTSPIPVDSPMGIFYYPPLHAMVVLPFTDGQGGLPVTMNRGVVAHAMHHRVWNELVFQGAGVPAVYDGTRARWLDTSTGTLTSAYKVLASVEEGLSDYFALSSLCNDPNDLSCDDSLFMEPTFGTDTANARDLNVETHCMTSSLLQDYQASTPTSSDNFLVNGEQYELGTIIGSSLYVVGKRLNQQQNLETAVLQSYTDPNPLTQGFREFIVGPGGHLNQPEAFTLEVVVGLIASHIQNVNLREQVCDELLGRLGLDLANVPDCPASASPVQVCPSI